MIKHPAAFVLLLLCMACSQQRKNNKEIQPVEHVAVSRIYSTQVADSFSVFIRLPTGYQPQLQQHYPVVYLLDANLYFDIMATTIDRYAEVGLAPDVILVGIGYKNLALMDSLRSRDDTYPLAIPEYEMSLSGGANRFLAFLQTELVPFIDRHYHADTTARVLMGHSLGGYFTLYAFLQQLETQKHPFSGYVAVSPSLHYNHYYLLNRLKANRPLANAPAAKLYLCYGGLEEADEGDTGFIPPGVLCKQLAALYASPQSGVVFRSAIHSQMGHMDTPLPGFLMGLQWLLTQPQPE